MEYNPVTPETEIVEPPINPEVKTKQRLIIIGGVILLLLLIAGIVLSIINLSGMPESQTGKIRDIFIIFMAVEFLIIGVALVVLIIQLAALINMLQNEVKPILNSTNETVSNLKGTAKFLSDNMVEPVIKLNEYLAGIKKLIDILNIFK
jgi:NADH:ubiquinone oxidoreductase subunit K